MHQLKAPAAACGSRSAREGFQDHICLGRPPAVDRLLADLRSGGDGVDGDVAVVPLADESDGRVEDRLARFSTAWAALAALFLEGRGGRGLVTRCSEVVAILNTYSTIRIVLQCPHPPYSCRLELPSLAVQLVLNKQLKSALGLIVPRSRFCEYATSRFSVVITKRIV